VGRTITLDLDAILDRAKRRVPDTVQLITLEPDAELSDQNIRLILTGNARAAEMDVWADYEADRQEEITRVIEQVSPEGLEQAVLLQPGGIGGELREFIAARASLDIFETLLAQTKPRLWRYELGLDLDGRVSGYSSDLDAARELAGVAGISFGANRAALKELAAAMGECGQLHVLWYGPATDLLRTALANGPGSWVEIAWQDPHLLILDSFEGRGHAVKVSGIITRHLNPSLCLLDAADHEGPGYSWSEVADLTPTDYAASIRLRPLRRLTGPARGGLGR
jgi:hypothetical protein